MGSTIFVQEQGLLMTEVKWYVLKAHIYSLYIQSFLSSQGNNLFLHTACFSDSCSPVVLVWRFFLSAAILWLCVAASSQKYFKEILICNKCYWDFLQV